MVVNKRDINCREKMISALQSAEKGYALDLTLTPEELQSIRMMIEAQWLAVIDQFSSELTSDFKNAGIENYHQYSHHLPHHALWPKAARILPQRAVTQIRDMPFIKQLSDVFGDFTISDEDHIESEELYWRLVRPHQAGDVGPMHADCWFWDLGHGVTPENCTRVKIWIPIYCEPGLNGLNVVPGSHMRDWQYAGEMRDGYLKPQFDQSQVDLPVILPKTNPGEAIIFNDRLLHKGVLNNGHKTRVSLEFTMFVDKQCLNGMSE
jgi:hypothetical protein